MFATIRKQYAVSACGLHQTLRLMRAELRHPQHIAGVLRPLLRQLVCIVDDVRREVGCLALFGCNHACCQIAFRGIDAPDLCKADCRNGDTRKACRLAQGQMQVHRICGVHGLADDSTTLPHSRSPWMPSKSNKGLIQAYAQAQGHSYPHATRSAEVQLVDKGRAALFHRRWCTACTTTSSRQGGLHCAQIHLSVWFHGNVGKPSGYNRGTCRTSFRCVNPRLLATAARGLCFPLLYRITVALTSVLDLSLAKTQGDLERN